MGGKQKAAQAVQAREIVVKERGNKRERENQAQTVLESAHKKGRATQTRPLSQVKKGWQE